MLKNLIVFIKIKFDWIKDKLSFLLSLFFMIAIKVNVFATSTGGGNISSSKIAQGTQKLIQDATSWALVVAPIVTTLAVIYFFIRKGMSDEMDHKKWNDRIIVAIISCIFAVSASVIIQLLIGYYQ